MIPFDSGKILHPKIAQQVFQAIKASELNTIDDNILNENSETNEKDELDSE